MSFDYLVGLVRSELKPKGFIIRNGEKEHLTVIDATSGEIVGEVFPSDESLFVRSYSPEHNGVMNCVADLAEEFSYSAEVLYPL